MKDVPIEFGPTPPDGLGFVSLGTRGRLLHLFSYDHVDGEPRLTLCGESLPWSAEPREAASGNLHGACLEAGGFTAESIETWEVV